MSICKPGRRVAYYKITNSTVPTVTVGTIVIDTPRGEAYYWNVWNEVTDERTGFGGERIGFARCDAEGNPVPELALEAALEDLRASSGSGEGDR